MMNDGVRKDMEKGYICCKGQIKVCSSGLDMWKEWERKEWQRFYRSEAEGERVKGIT